MDSIYDFKDRAYRAVGENEYHRYMNFKEVNFHDKQWDNPIFNWKMVYLEGNDEKYGRFMVSEKYKLRRNLTMGEFYGSSCVD